MLHIDVKDTSAARSDAPRAVATLYRDRFPPSFCLRDTTTRAARDRRTARLSDCGRSQDSLTLREQLPRERLERLLTAGENVVERLLKVRRRLRELASDLRDVLLVALLYFLLEELLQRSVADALVALLRKIGDEIGHESARQPLRFRVGVVGEKRI